MLTQEQMECALQTKGEHEVIRIICDQIQKFSESQDLIADIQELDKTFKQFQERHKQFKPSVVKIILKRMIPNYKKQINTILPN